MKSRAQFSSVKKPLVLAVLSAIAVMASAPGSAAVVNWAGTTGSWHTATNWSSNPLFPGAADDVFINVPGTQTITYSTGATTIQSLALGSLANPNNNLALSGGTLTITNLATITAGKLTLTGGTLQGGLASQGTVIQQTGTNGLVFTGSNSNTLDNVTVRGTLNVGDATNPSGRVRISNGLVLQTEAGGAPGVMNVGTVAGATNAVVGFNGTQTFNNATINLGNATQSANLALELGGTLTLGSGAVVQGRGALGAAVFVGGTNNLVNGGLISANINGGTLTVNPSGTFTNNGTAEARNGGILTIGPGGLWSTQG